MTAIIQSLTAEKQEKINYTALTEIMYERHHTRESVGKAIGMTGAGFGKYLSKGTPMPGSIVIKSATVLHIPTDEIAKYYYNGSGTSKQITFSRDELVMIKMLLIIDYTDLPESTWDDAQALRRKIECEIEANFENKERSAK